MKSQKIRSLALVLALLLPQSILAWNNTGHELVAAVAWDNMTPAAQQSAFRILTAASKNICLLELFPTNVQSAAERQRETFIIAATWADHIRSGPCETSLSHKPWHFTDHFWKGVSGASGSEAPQTATPAHPKPDEGNAVERLILFRPVVACAKKPCAAADERAEDLAWTLHLVGDIHQPLHSAARVRKENPDGDRGGNLFFLASDKTTNLHTFWDDIIDTSFRKNTDESPFAYLKRAETKIVQDHPREKMTSRLEPGDFASWSREGFETAEETAYPKTLSEQQAPSSAYGQIAFAKADEAIALGGYRLADLLNTILGADHK